MDRVVWKKNAKTVFSITRFARGYFGFVRMVGAKWQDGCQFPQQSLPPVMDGLVGEATQSQLWLDTAIMDAKGDLCSGDRQRFY